MLRRQPGLAISPTLSPRGTRPGDCGVGRIRHPPAGEVLPPLHRAYALVRNLFRGSARDAELRADIDGYVDLLTDEKIAAGLSPAAARRAARLESGSIDRERRHAQRARRCMADRDRAGCALCNAHDAAGPVLHRDRDRDARARHRCQHRDFQRGERGAVAAAASGHGSARAGVALSGDS